MWRSGGIRITSGSSNGLALLEKDGKLMYIDHDGAAVWEEK